MKTFLKDKLINDLRVLLTTFGLAKRDRTDYYLFEGKQELRNMIKLLEKETPEYVKEGERRFYKGGYYDYGD